MDFFFVPITELNNGKMPCDADITDLIFYEQCGLLIVDVENFLIAKFNKIIELR